jgi:hypothetical protein
MLANIPLVVFDFAVPFLEALSISEVVLFPIIF